jgi:hypothetical protein
MYFGRRAGGRRKRGAASFSSQHNNISPERFNARPVREIQSGTLRMRRVFGVVCRRADEAKKREPTS